MTAPSACPFRLALAALVKQADSYASPLYAEALADAKMVLANCDCPPRPGSVVQDGEYGVAVRGMKDRFDANEVAE